MKFFTRELYDAIQPGSGVDEEVAELQWYERREAYRTHLEQVRSELPAAALQLCDTTFHDGVVTQVEATDSNLVRIHIDARGNPWGPVGEFVLTFKGVKSSSGLDAISGDDWLYEELDVGPSGTFEYRVLLTNSEFRVVATDVDWTGARAIVVPIEEEVYRQLEKAAATAGTDVESLVSSVIKSWLANANQDFEKVARYVMEKNKELYERLS